jgi:hypothetical protein
MSSTDTSTTTTTTTETEQTSQTKTVSYIKAVTLITLNVLTTVAFGALIIYSCKVAQSNILPTDIFCSPYVNNEAVIKPIDININLTNIDGELLSQKIKFPIELNSKNILLDFLRKYKEKSNSSPIANYFISIIDGLVSLDYSAYNMFYNLLNEAPEMLIILFGPITTFLYSLLLSIVNLVYICYLWFSKMSWLFKENKNKSGKGKPEWRNITLIEPVNYGISLLLVFLFFLIFWVCLFTVFPFISGSVIIFCLASIIGMVAINSENQKYNFLNSLKDIFTYKKDLIMTVLSFFIVISAFSYLGTGAGVLSIITVILIYFNIIPISIFNVNKPKNLSSLSSYEQAFKECKPLPSSELKGFLERILFGQKGGGHDDIWKKIKKISNTLKK